MYLLSSVASERSQAVASPWLVLRLLGEKEFSYFPALLSYKSWFDCNFFLCERCSCINENLSQREATPYVS